MLLHCELEQFLMWADHQILASVWTYGKSWDLICWNYAGGTAINNDILTTDPDISC